MQTKDDEIIELYWKRDPKAIEETQTHYGEKLGRLSFGILENREDAQECVNDTYLRTWNSRQDRSFSLRTLQRYAVFYVLMCWIIKMRKSEVLW